MAEYASGKKHVAKTLKPGDSKQTYEVPPEPAEQVALQEEPEVEAIDPPADPKFIVTGLVLRA